MSPEKFGRKELAGLAIKVSQCSLCSRYVYIQIVVAYTHSRYNRNGFP